MCGDTGPARSGILIAHAWNNGSHHPTGAGYGVKITARDRDRYFREEWTTVALYLEGIENPVEVNIDKRSFWSVECRELISKEIGLWLRANGKALWSRGSAPKLELKLIGEAKFEARFVR